MSKRPSKKTTAKAAETLATIATTPDTPAVIPDTPASPGAVSSAAGSDAEAGGGEKRLTKKEQAARNRALGKNAKTTDKEAAETLAKNPPAAPANAAKRKDAEKETDVEEAASETVPVDKQRAMKRPRKQPAPTKKTVEESSEKEEEDEDEAEPMDEQGQGQVGGKSPKGATDKKKKPHRWRPGTVALREIKNQQKVAHKEPATRFLPFARLVREIAQDYETTGGAGSRWQKEAILALQQAGEQYLIDIYEGANELVILQKNVTIFPREIKLAKKLMFEKQRLISHSKG